MRRPDVMSAYLACQAADLDVATAISNQYPRISLTGSVINAAEHPETLFKNWFVSVAGQLVAPLLDGGEREAEIARTSAVASQRFHEYGETMLSAFREVEDNLTLERHQLQRIERLDAQVNLSQQAAEQLRDQYLIGDADYLDVLSANQTQQRLQREKLSARLELILIRIGLYLSLAGEFDTHPPSSDEAFAEQSESNSPDSPADGAARPSGPESLPPPLQVAPELELDE